MKLLFLDLETTGTDINNSTIHQLAGFVVIDGIVKETFDIKSRPGPNFVLNDTVLQLSGVNAEIVSKYPSAITAFNQFFNILIKYVDIDNENDDKFYIVGYNCQSFDIRFLNAWFYLNNGISYYRKLLNTVSIDVMVLANYHIMYSKDKPLNYKQFTVAKHLGLTVDENKLHDALYDIELCKDIYDKIGGNY